MAGGNLQLCKLLLVLIALLYLQTTWAESETSSDEQEDPRATYEVIGSSAGSDSENGIEGSNFQHVGIFRSRRQRRSAHLGGLYQGHSYYRPVYVVQRPQPQPVIVHAQPQPQPIHVQPQLQPQPVIVQSRPQPIGHGHQAQSQSQAQAISANFVGPYGSSGISGAAASAGAGGGSSPHLNHFGYGRK